MEDYWRFYSTAEAALLERDNEELKPEDSGSSDDKFKAAVWCNKILLYKSTEFGIPFK